MDNASAFEEKGIFKSIQRDLKLRFLLRKPDGYKPARLWPLVIFLHGAGEKDHDLQTVMKGALPRVILEGMKFPYWLACPQCPAELSGWPIEDLAILLDELIKMYPVDPKRVYLTGVSMGGRGTWEFAYDHAAKLAAIMPVCGFGIPNLAPRLNKLPIWAFHGAKDEILPVARTNEMILALQQAGNPALFTSFPELGHNCGAEVYRNPSTWQWLAVQEGSDQTNGRRKPNLGR
jgi:predicted peptidase